MSSTMNSPPLHQTDEIKELKIILGTKIQSFLQRLTAEQWELLKSCTADESMRVQMYELLVQIVKTLSNVLFTMAWRSIFLEDEIQAYLGNLVTDTFKTALDINDNFQCDSADSLIKLINEEVADRCNDGECAASERPKRFHMMVVHTIKMLKNFSVRMKKVVTHRSAKRSSTPDQEMERETEEETTFVEICRTESEEMIEPLKEENVINPDVESEDTAERTEGSEHRSISGSEPTVEEWKEMFMRIVIGKLFTRIFHKTQDGTIKENNHILQRLFERTWAEVEGVDFELSEKNMQNLDKIIFKDLCKQLGCADQVLLSLKRENDVIINSIVAAFNCSAAPKATLLQRIRNFFTYKCRRRRVGVVEKDPSDETIEPRAIPVFEFANLKLDTADGTEGGEHLSISESKPTAGALKEAFVEVVIEKLFTRIVDKTHCCKINDDKHILRRLYESILNKVEDIDFQLSQKNLHNLDKIIFKDLCKQLACTDHVVWFLREEDEAVVTSIVNAFNGCATSKRRWRFYN